MANEIEKKEDESASLNSAVSKASDYYIKDVIAINKVRGIAISPEGQQCMLNTMAELISVFGIEGVKGLSRNDINRALQFAGVTCLDVYSGQCFVDKRKTFNRDTKGWEWHFRMQPEGDAIELLIKRYGSDVKALHAPMVVHQGDEFTMPSWEGIHVTPPSFKPKMENLSKPAVLVVYALEKKDGGVDYPMANRESVARNLAAHILSNKLGDRPDSKDFDGGYKSAEFKKAVGDYEKGLEDMRKYLDGKGLDEMLSDPTLSEYISPAWKSPSAKEGMILRKMKKNALMHYTQDLGAKTKVLDESDDDLDQSAVAKDVVASQTGDGDEQAKNPKAIDMKVPEEGAAKPDPKADTKPAPDPKKDGTPKEPKTESKPISETDPNPDPTKEPKEEAKAEAEPDAGELFDPSSL